MGTILIIVSVYGEYENAIYITFSLRKTEWLKLLVSKKIQLPLYFNIPFQYNTPIYECTIATLLLKDSNVNTQRFS